MNEVECTRNNVYVSLDNLEWSRSTNSKYVRLVDFAELSATFEGCPLTEAEAYDWFSVSNVAYEVSRVACSVEFPLVFVACFVELSPSYSVACVS